jgi:uncharacterized LabA/DUF88 family protein
MPSTARRTDPEARVRVFIDGQNVFKGCEERYGHGHVHPILLARAVLAGRALAGIRYYSGVHDPHVNPRLHGLAQRRHALMRRTGVTVVERQLRYRWEWGLDQRVLPDPRKFSADHKLDVQVSPHRRAREKGIDLALGLDVVDLSLHRMMDVAVIVSSDTDLTEAARMVHFMTRAGGRVSVEAAVLNDRRAPILLEHYDYTHQLTGMTSRPLATTSTTAIHLILHSPIFSSRW